MLKKKYWVYKPHEDIHVRNLVRELKISETTAKLLINRGFRDVKKAGEFLHTKLDNLYDPYLLKDMDKAVRRIKDAISNNESIWIYGDYDVDGISSTALLLTYFKLIDYRVEYYIPDRIDEGYGINCEAIKEIASKGGSLIITVDCGITAFKEVETAKELGLDIIITDHHECHGQLPNALAIINPKQDQCLYPFDMLCGCGIALKLIQALIDKEIFLKHIDKFIDIVAIATIADMVPLIDENRIIVKHGLGIIEKTNNLGIKKLIESCGLEGKKITSGHIGFMIAPRINAAGRISSPQNAVKLLITDNEMEASELAKQLSEENSKRQKLEAEILEEAFRLIESDSRYETERVLVVYGEEWHHGVIGIVASRIVERYHKPTIVLSIDQDVAKGSARSIYKFNLFKALEACGDLFIKFGGHEQAAGLSLKAENIDVFRQRINEIATESLSEEDMVEGLYCDTELSLNKINEAFIEELATLEPYGIGNPSPQFFCINLKSKRVNAIGNDGSHLKIQLTDGKYDIDSIGFNLGYLARHIELEQKIGAVFTPELNYFNNSKKMQLRLKDIKIFNSSEEEFKGKYFDCFEEKVIKEKEDINYHSLSKYLHYYEDKDYFLINYINKAEGKLLIVVNTLEQAVRLLKLMEIRETDSRRTIGIFFKEENNCCHNNTINIIINPNIDKIRYKIYNNIIAYDFFFNKLDLDSFLNLSQERNTMLLYEKGDELSYEKLLEIITPNRRILAIIYKILKDNYNNANISYNELIVSLRDVYSNANKVLINRALTVLLEGNIIKDPFTMNKDMLYICFIENATKINIEDLNSYKLYINEFNNFNSFKNSLLQYIKEVT